MSHGSRKRSSATKRLRSIPTTRTPSAALTRSISWCRSLASALEQWRADWESRDTERYLAHYSPKFNDLAGFSAHRGYLELRWVIAAAVIVIQSVDDVTFATLVGVRTDCAIADCRSAFTTATSKSVSSNFTSAVATARSAFADFH